MCSALDVKNQYPFKRPSVSRRLDSQEAELDALSTGLTTSEFRISLIGFSLRVVVEHGVKQSKADRMQGRAKRLRC